MARKSESPTNSGSGLFFDALSSLRTDMSTIEERTFVDSPQVSEADIEAANPLRLLSSRIESLIEQQESELIRQLSYRKDQNGAQVVESDQVQTLLDEMYNRKDMDNKSLGVLWKNLTVKAPAQETQYIFTVLDLVRCALTEPFLCPARAVKHFFQLFAGDDIKKRPTRNILNDFHGCVQPGEMLLVLGPPGSGCSTFLKTVCNLQRNNLDVTGDISYGGIDWAEMAASYRSQVFYNEEEDVHFPTMTVRQTLNFALQCTTPDSTNRRAGETETEYQASLLTIMGKIFGISHTFETMVGNQFVRGVSGGERKRVSIAEVFAGRAALTGFDNSTRGLDSSTAVEYVRALRVLTNISKVSTIVTIYQASQVIYDFFDKVQLIYAGYCIYYGPAREAVQYFVDLGYTLHARQTAADFLTSITVAQERAITPGANPPDTPEGLALAYQRSNICKSEMKIIEELQRTWHEKNIAQRFRKSQTGSDDKRRSVYRIPITKQIWYCFKRQLLIGFALGSLVIDNGTAVVSGFVVGSLFYDQSSTTSGAFTRGGVIFSALLFNALSAVANLSGAFMSRPMIDKHKQFTFYRPFTFELGMLMAEAPRILIKLTIYNIILYFLSGLQYQAGKFFINYLTLFLSIMTLTSFFRALANLTSNLNVVLIIVGMLVQIMVLYTGYVVSRPSMRGWFVWFYYLNPLAYAFETLMANEFRGLYLTCAVESIVPAGEKYPTQGCAITGAGIDARGIDGEQYLHSAFHYSFDHLWRNIGFLFMFFIAFTIINCFAAEYRVPRGSGASHMRFKKTHATAKKRPVPQSMSEKVEAAEPATEGFENESHAVIHTSNAVFTFKDLCYDVPDPAKRGQMRRLINRATGYVKPGTITCLMGSSGAGKTTLLNTLAQRQTVGIVTGEMLVDGNALSLSFARNTGYCEQMDVHLPESTVREALEFSAILRQDASIPKQEKLAYVEKIIQILEMQSFADAMIGTLGSGLSIEQRKRLTMAVELVAKPALLLFLDEPTSGLDSQASWSLITFLKRLAAAGQALLVTIHQPSALLFQQFDNILLLGSGGRTLYFGEIGVESQTMIAYFVREGAQPCDSEANPAEWVLDVVGAGGGVGAATSSLDWHAIWADSSECSQVDAEVARISAQSAGLLTPESSPDCVRPTLEERKFAETYPIQFYMVLRRLLRCYWRSPDYIANKMILHILTGLLNCFTFFKLGQSGADQQNRLFSLFMILVISPPLIQTIQPRFFAMRGLFLAREGRSGMYHWTTWVASGFLVEVPYILVAGSLLFCCWYWGPGFPTAAVRSGHVWLYIMVFELWFTSFAMMVASAMPNPMSAALLTPILFTFLTGFAGVTNPPSQIPTFWRRWIYPVNPFRYFMGGLLTLVESGTQIRCATNEFALFSPSFNQSCSEYAGKFADMAGGYLNNPDAFSNCEYCPHSTGDKYTADLNVHYHDRWRNYGIIWAYIAFNLLMMFFFTWMYLGGPTTLFGRLRQGSAKMKSQMLRNASSQTQVLNQAGQTPSGLVDLDDNPVCNRGGLILEFGDASLFRSYNNGGF